VKPINVVGSRVDIVIADDEEEPDLEGRDGCYSHDEGRILIDEDLAPALRWPILGHEIGHAVCKAISIEHQLIDQFHLSDNDAEKLEELICRLFVPVFLDTLERNKWLRPPVVR